MKRAEELQDQFNGKVVAGIRADSFSVEVRFDDGSRLEIETDGRDGASLTIRAYYVINEVYE